MLINGKKWLDSNKNVLHSHGGCIIKYNDYYYWYGENRNANILVSCYKSKNLMNWEFCNNILTMNSKIDTLGYDRDSLLINRKNKKILLERPKVIYNEKIKKFVLWAHYEDGIDYKQARCAVASCDTPDGDFVYHGSFRPCDNMSRDCTLFYDNGICYFVSAGNNNKDLYCYRLSNDFLNIEEFCMTLFKGKLREAPAFFKENGKYYCLTSGCTGWKPNQGKYAVSESFLGEWSELKNFGDKKTYRTQPTYVIQYNDTLLYISDRWNSRNYNKSTYCFYELKIINDEPILRVSKFFDSDILKK